MGASTLRSPLPFVAGSYAEGVALALVAGLLVGLAALWLGSAPWFVPVVVAVVVTMAMLATTIFATPGTDLVPAMARVSRVFFPASLAATVVCWLLTRRLLRFT